MKWKIDHVPLLLIASTLAMIGLVIFQYKWIDRSRKLSNEIFAQRASMALCSTLEEYGGGALCNNLPCAPTGSDIMPSDSEMAVQSSLIHNEDFQADLRRTLDFYNIDLNYRVTQTGEKPAAPAKSEAPCCIVNVPSGSNQQASFIKLDFPDKENFILGKLKYMIGSTVLILLFTAFVLLLANWWLLKQKRLLQTNVDIYNNMAHEFRTPLTNISLAANLLSKNAEDPKSQKFLEIISRENSKLIQQVERVLHLAKLDNSEYALVRERMELKSVLEPICDDLGIQIEERGASIQMDNVATDLEIYGDRLHLSNVFRNLIDNALKYGGDRPQISIYAKDLEDNILISVQDSGPGIPSSQRQSIFEKFQRIQHGNLHEQKGFGLGLAYVKRIIEMHKGKVELDCEFKNGSRFNVYIPKMC
jgi:signal transduction histidine kinase